MICIEEETGFAVGSLTYAAKPDSGLLVCNQCLATKSDRELAEYYAMFSTKYWHEPVSADEVLASLEKKPSRSLIRRYWDLEKQAQVIEIKNLDNGSVSKTWYTNL
jgi:hypothetical protein